MSWASRYTQKKAEGAEAGTEWKTVGRPATFMPIKKPVVEPKVDMNSEEQFPALGGGGGGKAKEAPKPKLKGYATLANAWATQDAEEAAVEKKRQEEEAEEEQKRVKEAARYPSVLERINLRRHEERFVAANDEDYEAHSPTYGEDYEEQPRHRNTMLEGPVDDDDEDGWATR